ncbi:gephyrin-like molybdotransferase receptor GlpR [Pseudonocardia nigra]|uniref:gephyrin-like molybdotransferase receptor GlpR n=1 Tax=Pseudonocardia nigra TaxID=1921578 RepID=UPI001C5EE9D0|nr:gephyrin-like molybdotransferase receptor GlpR [Pseudonocardia nigra]
MPSSLIFASLVVLWLLILVPAVARRRQEVARPSVAALSGRVLERPRQRRDPGLDCDPETGRELEVDVRDDGTRAEGRRRGDDRDDRRTDPVSEERAWERPPPRYRPGRGGFDPEAAALAARARYAFRQRVVLAMLVVAVLTGVIAAVAVPGMWWPHAAVDLVLVGYLVYLRRQVRLEESIRERRAARMAGTRRPSAADDPELDAWARRGREVTRRRAAEPDLDDEYDGYDERDEDLPEDLADDSDRDDGPADDLLAERPERVRGTGQPLRSAGERDAAGDPTEGEPALPRLRPAPPPPLPAGTALVEADEDDPELHGLDVPARRGYRRAAGE